MWLFQQVKIKQFESNSQRSVLCEMLRGSCFSRSKLNSLKAIHNVDGVCSVFVYCCFSRSKLNSLKAIHNSVVWFVLFSVLFQQVKIKQFESNSQRSGTPSCRTRGCFSRSKLNSLKAIHNWVMSDNRGLSAVSVGQN